MNKQIIHTDIAARLSDQGTSYNSVLPVPARFHCSSKHSPSLVSFTGSDSKLDTRFKAGTISERHVKEAGQLTGRGAPISLISDGGM